MKVILATATVLVHVTFIGVCLWTVWLGDASPAHYSWSDIRNIHQEEIRRDEEMQREQRFSAAIARAKTAVRMGALSLCAAAEELHAEVERVRPPFLDVIAARYPDHSPRDLMVRTLLTHFEVEEYRGGLSPAERERIACGRFEFEWQLRNRAASD